MMAMNGVFSRPRWSEEADGFGLLRSQGEAHVLAVDDSLVDRKVIERLLKVFSCKVTAVDSGRRALQFLGLDEDVDVDVDVRVEERNSVVEGLKVDLIITDYCMPGMTGFELLKKIKESSAFKEIPVVIMSSENVLTRIDRCLEEGAEDFIVKPVKLADVERLKDHLMAKDGVSKTSNKRKQPDGPDLSDYLTSAESTPSVTSTDSSPTSQSLASTPSSARSSASPPPDSPPSDWAIGRLRSSSSCPDLTAADPPL